MGLLTEWLIEAVFKTSNTSSVFYLYLMNVTVLKSYVMLCGPLSSFEIQVMLSHSSLIFSSYVYVLYKSINLQFKKKYHFIYLPVIYFSM